MKFKEFLEKANKLAEENPKSLDMEVVYSKDDEGNGYGNVHYDITMGNFDGDSFGLDYDDSNSVCIN